MLTGCAMATRLASAEDVVRVGLSAMVAFDGPVGVETAAFNSLIISACRVPSADLASDGMFAWPEGALRVFVCQFCRLPCSVAVQALSAFVVFSVAVAVRAGCGDFVGHVGLRCV